MKPKVAWETGRTTLQVSRTRPTLVAHMESPFHFHVYVASGLCWGMRDLLRGVQAPEHVGSVVGGTWV